MTEKKLRKQLISFHLENIKDYAQFWARHHEGAAPKDMSKEEAAFMFVSSVVEWSHLTGSGDAIEAFMKMNARGKRELASDVCTYICELNPNWDKVEMHLEYPAERVEETYRAYGMALTLHGSPDMRVSAGLKLGQLAGRFHC